MSDKCACAADEQDWGQFVTQQHGLRGMIAVAQDWVLPRPGLWVFRSKKAESIGWNLMKLLAPSTIQGLLRGSLRIGFFWGVGEAGSLVVASFQLTTDQKLLWFDHSSGRVLRLGFAPEYSERYALLRGKFDSVVHCPRFSVLGGGKVLSEEYISGVPLPALTADNASDLIRQIIHDLSLLNRESNRWDGFTNAEMRHIKRFLAEDGFSQQEVRDVESVICDSPTVASSGDLLPRNVFAVQGSYVVLDLAPEHLSIRPFWFDAVFLAVWSLESECLFTDFSGPIEELWKKFLPGRKPPASAASLIVASALCSVPAKRLSHGVAESARSIGHWLPEAASAYRHFLRLLHAQQAAVA